MGFAGVVFALFTLGYTLGVWTALLVTKQSQGAYEDAAVASISDVPVIVLRRAAVTAARSSPDTKTGALRP